MVAELDSATPPTCLVFGHSSGLGLAVTRLLLVAGYRVVGFSRSSAELASSALHEVSADLSIKEDVLRTVDIVREKYSGFEILLYSAGALAAHEIHALDYETLEYLYRVNVFAPMIIESHLFDLIAKNGADVVNISSSSIIDHYSNFAEYSTSKAAFAKFTGDLQRALTGCSARVIDVCPSGFESKMYSTMLGDSVQREESVQMPVSEMAKLIVDLLKLPKRMEVGRVYINRK